MKTIKKYYGTVPEEGKCLIARTEDNPLLSNELSTSMADTLEAEEAQALNQYDVGDTIEFYEVTFKKVKTVVLKRILSPVKNG